MYRIIKIKAILRNDCSTVFGRFEIIINKIIINNDYKIIMAVSGYILQASLFFVWEANDTPKIFSGHFIL